jgi:hypothetical protein
MRHLGVVAASLSTLPGYGPIPSQVTLPDTDIGDQILLTD